jgi:hypothetical protein
MKELDDLILKYKEINSNIDHTSYAELDEVIDDLEEIQKKLVDCHHMDNVKNELLKQCHLMVYDNGYPSEAVPKATILSLKELMGSK